jgi:hypothetical protein
MAESAKEDGAELVYVAIDGDDIGRRLEQLIAEGDDAAVAAYSRHVSSRLSALAFLAEKAGNLVYCAGDSLLARVRREAAAALCELALADEVVRFSGGIGQRMVEAMLSMRLAKARGRGQFFTWTQVIGPPHE